MARFFERKPLLWSLVISAIVLAATSDERVFGLVSDGQIMTRTAFSMVELGEIGIAQGHQVNVTRPQGDAVTRYGMGATILRIAPVLLAGPIESAFGAGASQTLFVLENILLILLAAFSSGVIVRSWGGSDATAGRAVLATAIASPLWAYAASDFAEPVQAAALAGAFALASRARATGDTVRKALLLAALAGAAAGFAVLSKSVFIVLLPFVLALAVSGGAGETRIKRSGAFLLGWLPFGALWLAFEIVRFGRPFAGYEGEHFSYPVLDGLWRLTVGPNKGLFLYFPLGLLAVLGAASLFRKDRIAAAGVAGFSAFLLLSTAAWWSWDGASGWGPRLLIPGVPLLAALAALASASLPSAVFRVLFALGVAVNAIGVLQPDAATTWCYMVLPMRVLSEAETKNYAVYAYLRDPDGTPRLGPWFEVSRHADLSQLRFSAWILARRLSGADLEKALKTPPWDTTVPAQRVETPPREAMPDSALVFLTTPFRWPHLGMSLFRRADESDTVLSYIDCFYDQALRAQDMKSGDRAIMFAEEIWRRIPGPQSATALAEAYRIAGRKETLAEFLRSVPSSWRGSPEWGVVVALHFRDRGEDEKAVRTMKRVVEIAPRPEFQRLMALAPGAWPATLREIQLAALRSRTRS